MLTLLDADGETAHTEASPTDMALSRGDRFLYALNAGGHSISSFALHADGSLEPVEVAGGLPAGANGLVAF
jgi:hypothetical protein